MMGEAGREDDVHVSREAIKLALRPDLTVLLQLRLEKDCRRRIEDQIFHADLVPQDDDLLMRRTRLPERGTGVPTEAFKRGFDFTCTSRRRWRILSAAYQSPIEIEHRPRLLDDRRAPPRDIGSLVTDSTRYLAWLARK